MVILGIDPGTARVGYGVVEILGNKITHLDSGLIKVSSRGVEALSEIESGIKELVRRRKPERVGVEKLFFVKNQKTGIRVAEARGVILNAALKAGLGTVDAAPTEVKLALTGSGNASKEAVAKMVRYFVRLPDNEVVDDVTDALAIAIAASRRNSF